MKVDIKDIELFIDFCRAPYNFEHKSEEKSYKELSDKIEHLIKAYKELEEKWDKDTHKLQNALDMANADKINNYIPVSLVEETKKELYDNYINSNGDNFLKLEHQLEILEKLLEKRK